MANNGNHDVTNLTSHIRTEKRHQPDDCNYSHQTKVQLESVSLQLPITAEYWLFPETKTDKSQLNVGADLQRELSSNSMGLKCADLRLVVRHVDDTLVAHGKAHVSQPNTCVPSCALHHCSSRPQLTLEATHGNSLNIDSSELRYTFRIPTFPLCILNEIKSSPVFHRAPSIAELSLC